MIFCVRCREEVEPRVVEREEVYPVRGEEIAATSQVAVCPQCGTDLVDEDLEGENLRRAYMQYRAVHNLLSPEEIRAIRSTYGLSQRGLSALLGWGAVTIHRYESGAIQDCAHDMVLRLAANPENMRGIAERNRSALPAAEARRLETAIGAALAGQAEARYERALARMIADREPCEANGYSALNLEKLEALVIFFAMRAKNVFKTKLNKLLWYVDFVAFRDLARSVTGSVYVAAPHGPVPQHYDILLGEMVRKGLVRLEERDFESGTCGELVVPLGAPNMRLFSPEEQKCIQRVAREFSDCTATSIRTRSHAEPAYRKTYREDLPWQSQVISYALAKTVSVCTR